MNFGNSHHPATGDGPAPDNSGDSPRPLQVVHLDRRREDSLMVRNALEAEGMRCEILRVESRTEFLSAIKECRLDLVIADFFEPSFDGLSLLRTVRELAPELPVIFLVADFNAELARTVAAAGAADIVLKIEPARLANVVRSALAIARLRAGKIFTTLPQTEAEQRLRGIAESLGQSFWSCNAETGELLFANAEFEWLLGVAPEFLSSRRFKVVELVHSEDRERVAEALDVRARKAECQIEFRVVRPDGGARWVWTRLFPVFEHGHVPRIAGITEDITHRKADETAWRESQRKMSALIDALPGVVFACTNDPEWTLTYVSEGVHQATGYRREELLRNGGEIFRSLVHPGDQSRVQVSIEAALRTNQPYVVEYRVRTKGGHERWLWEKGQGIYDSTGKLLGREGFITDVTERKRTEDTLHQQTDLLRGAALAAQHLLTEVNQESAISKAITTLGLATGADRVYLCENISTDEPGRLKLLPRVEWTREPIGPSISQNNLAHRTYGASGLARWQRELAAGNVICGVQESFPTEEREWLARDDIKSVLLAPIIVEGELFGFLGLDACLVERYWTAAEQSILTAAAAGIGGVLRSRRDKRALAAAESRYREIFENSFEGIFQSTPEGRYLNANPAMARIQGFDSPEQMINAVDDIAHGIYFRPEDRDEFKRRMERDGVVRGFEYPIRRRNGEIIWVQENSRAVCDTARKLHYYEGTMRDITVRKQMEQALRESEQLYHSLVENLPVHLFRKDTEGRMTFVNSRFCDLVGRNPGDMIGKTDYDLFPRELAQIYREGDQQVMTTQRMLEAEEEQVTTDGLRFHIHVIKTPIFDANRKVVGVQGMFWDVSAQHDAEFLLRTSNQQLESTLRELKKAQQRIVQQERLHALGQMSSGIAHDFNNTLMAILGFTELLLMHPETLDNKPKVISYLKTMSTAAKDAATVVKRLNDFYRHREEGEIFPPVSLNKLVEQAVALTQPKWKGQAQANGVQIDVQTELQEVLPVAGHEGELRESLINLIFNAIDAMPEGGNITLRTRMEEEAAVLEIADTGAGMTEEVRKRCFEPFFSTKGQKGTGLGLSMVFGIIQRHQGTIDIQSIIGQGTRLIVKLPALRQINNKGGDTEILGQPSRPLDVLVVDDEPLIRQILAEYLSTDGHSVVTACDGREALMRFAEKHFDLILTDRSMPNMSGDHLADAIKQVDPARPVVLLTGFGDMMNATGQKPKSVDVVMAKPITLNALRLSLAQAIGRN